MLKPEITDGSRVLGSVRVLYFTPKSRDTTRSRLKKTGMGGQTEKNNKVKRHKLLWQASCVGNNISSSSDKTAPLQERKKYLSFHQEE